MKTVASQDSDCFSQTLKRCWKSFMKRWRKCKKRPSNENVHQFRVASRRLLAELRLLKEAIPGLKTGRVRRFLTQSRKHMGELRDTQVQRELLTNWAENVTGAELLQAHLMDRERRLLKKVRSELDHSKYEKLRDDISQIQERLKQESSTPQSRRALVKNAQRCAKEAFAETARMLQAVNYRKPETIHRTRIAFKKFRYTMEALPESLACLSPERKQALAAYQDRMGHIQDLGVTETTAMGFEKSHPDQALLMVQFRKQLRTVRTKAVTDFKRSSRDLLRFRPRFRSSH
jgi:CHAD domain-containing protein